MPRAESVDAGEYAVGDSLAVLLPRQAILLPTVVLVTGFPVHQQDGEINHIEIRQNVIETTREGPRQGHDEITQVIGVANKTPPSRNKKIFSR